MDIFRLIESFFGGLFGFAGMYHAADQNLEAVREANQANIDMNTQTNLTNAAIAQATNDTNLALVEKTNQANKDIAYKNNLFAQKQADLAYQRSTPANQIAELVKSGMSYQQAKQIVAGSGQAAQYTAVTPNVATMEAAQMQPYALNPGHVEPGLLDANAFANASGALGGSVGAFADDLARPDGGTFGQMVAAPAVQAICDNMSSIDENDLTSVKALSNWLNSDRSKMLTDKQRKQVGYALKSFVGSRALLQQLKSYTSSFSDSQHFKSLVEQVKQAQIQTIITDLQRQLAEGQIDLQDLDVEFNNLRNQKQIELQPFEVQSTMQNLLNSFQQASAQTELWSTDKFRKAWLANQLADENVRSLVIMSHEMEANMKNMTLQAANDYQAKHKVEFGIYHLFKEAGMTDSMFGQIIAGLTAGSEGKLDPIQWIENILGVVNDEFNSDTLGAVSSWNYTKDAEIRLKRAKRTGDYSDVPGITRHAKHSK